MPQLYLIDGALNHKAPLSNLALNAPHVILSTIILTIAYWLSPREEREEDAGRIVPVPA